LAMEFIRVVERTEVAADNYKFAPKLSSPACGLQANAPNNARSSSSTGDPSASVCAISSRSSAR